MIRPLEPDVAGPAHSSADPPNGGRRVIGHERTSTSQRYYRLAQQLRRHQRERQSHAGREPVQPICGRRRRADKSRLRDARTIADRRNHTCSGPTTELVKETWYDPVVVADGDLTIGNVRVVGDGVDLLDADGAVIRQGG